MPQVREILQGPFKCETIQVLLRDEDGADLEQLSFILENNFKKFWKGRYFWKKCCWAVNRRERAGRCKEGCRWAESLHNQSVTTEEKCSTEKPSRKVAAVLFNRGDQNIPQNWSAFSKLGILNSLTGKALWLKFSGCSALQVQCTHPLRWLLLTEIQHFSAESRSTRHLKAKVTNTPQHSFHIQIWWEGIF